MKLEKLNTYNLSMNIGEKVWKIVNNWDDFSKVTLGKQLVEATDSIALNLSESYKIKNSKEAKDLAGFSLRHLNETKTLLTKASHRKLINEKEYNNISTEINMINYLLKKYVGLINHENNHNNNVKTKRLQREYL